MSGAIEVPARIERTRPREGTVFAPFHYGYWDEDEAGPTTDGEGSGKGNEARVPPRAANELTRSWWDPVSKQPMFKTAAVSVTKVAR